MLETLPTASELPDALTSRDQWVCWRRRHRDGDATKVPVDPETGSFASTADPETWSSFDRARHRASAMSAVGLGFVFTESDSLVGVDLDDCRDPATDTADQWARDVIDRLDSFTEVSPSGTGYHVIARGTFPDGRNRHRDLELYETRRFFTVTGDHVSDTPHDVTESTDALTGVYTDRVAVDENADADDERESDGESSGQADEAGQAPVELSDDRLIEKAGTAANGEKFQRLWDGRTTGYDSHSEADMALCSLLAFWTGGDASRMDRLFRRSGLMREKWDTVHFADGSTYGEKTVERAIDGCSSWYTPPNDDTAESDAQENTPGGGYANGADSKRRAARDGGQPVCSSTADRTDGIDDVAHELETALDYIDELEAALRAERNRRRELESRLEQAHSPWWWPFR